jgi:uncharacterized protein (TIGR02757 family)
MHSELQVFLNSKVKQYNNPSFILSDPICIPHLFTRKQDIEIAGFFAAVFAWGNRTTIIKKSKELLQLMDNSPYEFCLNHEQVDLKRLLHFKHRTFNTTDLLYFIEFFKHHYKKHPSLEDAFTLAPHKKISIESSLVAFHNYFFSLQNSPSRTQKHIATPERNSTCKRLNMFLRWMVRKDNCGVDFGIWKKIKPAQLIAPIDVHVARVARNLNLLQRKQTDWYAAIELTDTLRKFDSKDPVKYDFALFSLGVMEEY